MGNDIFVDALVEAKMGEKPAIVGQDRAPKSLTYSSDPENERDGFLALVGTGPDSKYEYAAQIKALIQIGFLVELDKGIFVCDDSRWGVGLEVIELGLARSTFTI